MSSPSLSVDQIKDSLKRLRQGHGLGRPTSVLTTLAEPVRAHLGNGAEHAPGSTQEVDHLVAILRQAIEELTDGERLYVEVDFNLVADHRYPTLTERQESLAELQKCAVKTVRRHADRALDTLAYLLLTNDHSRTATARNRDTSVALFADSPRAPKSFSMIHPLRI